MRFKPLVTAVAIAWMSQTPVHAAIVTFHFRGNVTWANGTGVNDPVLAHVQFDTSTPDLYPADPTRGNYVDAGSIWVEIGGLLFAQSNLQVAILHNGNGGQELLEFHGHGQPTAWPAHLPTYDFPEISYFFWQTGQTFTMLQSDSLPTAVDFNMANAQLNFVSASTWSRNMYEIQFNHLEQVDVPEPGTAVALAGGLLLCILSGAARSVARR